MYNGPESDKIRSLANQDLLPEFCFWPQCNVLYVKHGKTYGKILKTHFLAGSNQ